LFLHYLEKENEQNIAFLLLVLLLYPKNTQNTHSVHIFFILLADSLSNCPFLTAYKNV